MLVSNLWTWWWDGNYGVKRIGVLGGQWCSQTVWYTLVEMFNGQLHKKQDRDPGQRQFWQPSTCSVVETPGGWNFLWERCVKGSYARMYSWTPGNCLASVYWEQTGFGMWRVQYGSYRGGLILVSCDPRKTKKDIQILNDGKCWLQRSISIYEASGWKTVVGRERI
jgi:hypothetical protein